MLYHGLRLQTLRCPSLCHLFCICFNSHLICFLSINLLKSWIVVSYFSLNIVFFKILQQSRLLVIVMVVRLKVSEYLGLSYVLVSQIARYQLGHLSLSILKKLCPQITLECESCQFAKHHRLFSIARINKRALFLLS